jgi:hypothetical protein
MAELSRDGEELVLTLSTAEKAESLHGDIRVPLASVREVDVVEDVIHEVHGMKFPGSRWPGRFMIGTLAHATGMKSFAVVHHDTARGVRVHLEDAPFSELLVGCADPEAIAAFITSRN